MFVKIIYISLHQKYPVVKEFLNLSTELYALNLFILILLDKNNLTAKKIFILRSLSGLDWYISLTKICFKPFTQISLVSFPEKSFSDIDQDRIESEDKPNFQSQLCSIFRR